MHRPVIAAVVVALLLLGTLWVVVTPSAPSDPLRCLRAKRCPLDATAWTRIAAHDQHTWKAALSYCLDPGSSFAPSCLPVSQVAYIRSLDPATKERP